MNRPARWKSPWLHGSACLAAAALCSCTGAQSTLEPAGDGAHRIASLFWWMTGGAAVIWLITMGLAFWASRPQPQGDPAVVARRMIVYGGAVIPTIVLAVLLVYGLRMLPPLIAPAPEGAQRIEVAGEQWWWRIRYRAPDGTLVPVDNEVRLPVGEPVEFILNSSNVIHSFWIPSLGGKMDMIPGRETRLVLHPQRTGVFRGICAEYCGGSHALMALDVIVMEKADYETWLAGQRAPAPAPAAENAQRGQRLFLSNGCSACHAIRGTEADGAVGPDLTHVGSRLSIGAGILPSNPENFRLWLAKTPEVKPGVHMPHFGMLPDDELKAIAAYLDSLE